MDSRSRDAFFTKNEIAKRFVDKVNEITPFDKFDNIVEPSAGSGRILNHLPINAVGYDLHPLQDNIIEADFFRAALSKDLILASSILSLLLGMLLVLLLDVLDVDTLSRSESSKVSPME